VDEAEHKRKPVLILRHGKPAAAIVPVDVVLGHKPTAPRPMSADEARAFLDRLVARATSEPVMGLEEALGRNRLDRF